MEHLGRMIVSVLGGIFVLFILIVLLQGNFFEQTGRTVGEITDLMVPPSNTGYYVGYYNMEEELSNTPEINALPSDVALLLKFYNFNSGEREWERAYILRRGEVLETENFDENADLIISIDSKYLQELTNRNFCDVLKKATKNEDAMVEENFSGFTSEFKFKSIYSSRDCFGF